MLRNYLTVAFRTLARNKMYAFINILGLALGLAACLILLLYVRYETSYDGWMPEADRVFQVQTFGVDPETGDRIDIQGATQPVAAALRKDFPQLEAVTRLESDGIVVLKDGKALTAEAEAADPSFFQIIRLPFLRGDAKTALKDPDSLVLSRAEAMRLFGGIDILGRVITTVRYGTRFDMRVSGVFEDLPRNSHMKLDMVRRFNSGEEANCPWGCVNGYIYAKLKPGVNVESINAQMPAWEKRNVPERDISGADIGGTFDWRLVNVKDIHLGPAQDGDRPGNDMRTIVTFTLVALLILSMACINFVNLATARASQRAREVAVRKVLGAKRRQLVLQFLGESIAVVACAMLIALALVELVLPAFSAYLDADLDLVYLGAGGIAPVAVGLTLLVGLIGGLYPAFYLSRYKPATVLKANKSSSDTRGNGQLRNALVVVQFAVSIGLIICTAVVYRQTMFARTADPGYQREGLLSVSGLRNSDVARVREALSREIAKVDGVTNVAATMVLHADGPGFYRMARVPGQPEPIKISWYSVEPGFFETMRIAMRAGRPLSKARAADSIVADHDDEKKQEEARRAIVARGFNIVVNALGAKRLGFASAAEAVGKQIQVPPYDEEQGLSAATIVGVSGDTRFRSIREPVEPIIYVDAGRYRWLAIRYQAADPDTVRRQVEGIWRRMLPDVPFEASFMQDDAGMLYSADSARGQTFAAFAGMAVLIACLGLFGLAAFTAERRTKEIGIRKVFGARVRDIVRLLAWQFSKPVVIANLIAWPIAWWAMRDWLNTFDARIDLGPGPFLLAGLLALVIALGTVAGHALKIARLNPIRALRYE